MKRFKVRDFSAVLAWTEAFCRVNRWKTEPYYLEDDLLQECYLKWEKICALYPDKDQTDVVKIYKAGCTRLVLDLACKNTVRKRGKSMSDGLDYAAATTGPDTERSVLLDFLAWARANLSSSREGEYDELEMTTAVRAAVGGDRDRETTQAVQALVGRLGEHRIRQYLVGA